jgi:uncharacterized alkaline shock family protein YloU
MGDEWSSIMTAATTTPLITPPATDTEMGTTTVDQDVIAQVASIAAHDVTGVYALGGSTTRAIGVIRNAINATDKSQGAAVEVTDDKVAVTVTLAAEYPISLQKVASDVRSAVVLAVETIVGLEVTAVNVTINSIHTTEEAAPADAAE